MVNKFRGYLGAQLKKIVLPPLPSGKHARTPLIDNDRALSTASSKEDGVRLINLAITLADGLRTVGLFFVPHDHGPYLWHVSLRLCRASRHK